LRSIRNVIRKGYLRAVERDRLVLDQGEVPLKPNTLIVDCSASGISRRPKVPVWDGNRINIQMIRTCQPNFSAAFIGFMEATFADDAEKNALCAPVPDPVIDTDWLRMLAATSKNRSAWRTQPKIEAWLAQARLNGLFAAPSRVKPDDAEKMATLNRLQDVSMTGLAKLPQLLASLG
jgi:hypothetical protein